LKEEKGEKSVPPRSFSFFCLGEGRYLVGKRKQPFPIWKEGEEGKHQSGAWPFSLIEKGGKATYGIACFPR